MSGAFMAATNSSQLLASCTFVWGTMSPLIIQFSQVLFHPPTRTSWPSPDWLTSAGLRCARADNRSMACPNDVLGQPERRGEDSATASLCFWCERPDINLEDDHVFPRAIGGANELFSDSNGNSRSLHHSHGFRHFSSEPFC